MKRLFIIANWKSNKNIEETERWLHDFNDEFKNNPFNSANKEVIVAPSFTLLEHANYCLGNLKLPIKFSAQDVSSFDEGAYTGEVSAKQIKELAAYVIVGHSERRKHFKEDEEMINKKLDQVFKYELIPVMCVSNLDQVKSQKSKVKSQKILVAYEPLFAIGTGKPDTPENADKMAQDIRKELGSIPVLYGGSVTPENVKAFTSMPDIDGVLVGGASLDPHGFLDIVKNA